MISPILEEKKITATDLEPRSVRHGHKLSKIQRQYATLIWPNSRGPYRKDLHGPIGSDQKKMVKTEFRARRHA